MRLQVAGRLSSAGLAICLTLVVPALAQDGEYVPPRFIGGINGIAAQPLPQMPASPLAGGVAAAQGQHFMDAQGNPIILPANYCPSCPGGDGGYCPTGPGGYGDPMAIDFGGFGAEQCGPHYFDVSADVVVLLPQDPFDGVGPVVSVGAGTNLLNVTANNEEYEAGWQIAGNPGPEYGWRGRTA